MSVSRSPQSQAAAPAAPTQRTALHVAELDCASEARQLRSQLETRNGVAAIEFDVINGRMNIDHDPGEISVDELIGLIGQIGMRAERADASAGPTPAASGWSWREAAIGLAAVGVIAGFAAHWIISGSLSEAVGYRAAATGVPWFSQAAYLLAILAGFWFVVPRAFAALRTARADMNVLMCLAVAGAMVLGQWLEAATVSMLFGVALLLEQWSMGRARRAIAALLAESPPTARCVAADGSPLDRPVEQVTVGTRIDVRPGERFPLDGTVAEGQTSVNEAPLTGESRPVAKQPGSPVYAGSVNGEGAVTVDVTRVASDTALARIIHLVQEAHARRAPTEQWVDQFARYYTPVVMLLAVAVAVLPPLVASGTWTVWIYQGLALLVIACPCALVISTPVSLVSALTSAVRRGVLIKGGRYLETCAALGGIALDKTGTLTRGEPAVQEVLGLDGHSRREVLEIAAALESASNHPLASAIRLAAAATGLPANAVTDHQLLAGRGAAGLWNGDPVWIGNRRLLLEQAATSDSTATAGNNQNESNQQCLTRLDELEDAGHSVVVVGRGDRPVGLITLADSVRPQATATIRQLHSLGVDDIWMITGDNEQTARQVAATTGVDRYVAETLPEDKVAEVERLAARHQAVAMVGDGVNDSPALAAASVGIAMAAVGSDAAIETADIALLSDDLEKLPWLITHARRTLAIVRQNIVLAVGLKLVFVALAIGGAASLWLAIAADMGVSLIVIFNGLRLLRE